MKSTVLVLTLLIGISMLPQPSGAVWIRLPAPDSQRGVVALDQALRELTNPFTVLSVAARPGLEDAGTIAYCRKRLGARTVSLFATGQDPNNADSESTSPEE